MGVQFTETEIDSILDSVDAAMGKAAALAKSAVPAACAANGGTIKPGLKKDDMPVPPSKEEGDVAGSASPSPESAPADGAPEGAPAPAPEAAAPAPDGAPEAAPAADGAPEAGQPAEGEQQLEGEENAPLSDEELSEIYGGMEPQELERHFMLIRGLLQQAYAKEGGQAAAPAAPAPEAAAAPAAAPAAEPMVAKSEVSQLQIQHEQLKAQYAELQKSLENTVKVLEVAFKPERKAVTDLAFIKKGEESATSGKPLVKSEVVPVLNELTRTGKLSKSDRDAVNDYILRNESADKIAEIINRK